MEQIQFFALQGFIMNTNIEKTLLDILFMGYCYLLGYILEL